MAWCEGIIYFLCLCEINQNDSDTVDRENMLDINVIYDNRFC